MSGGEVADLREDKVKKSLLWRGRLRKRIGELRLRLRTRLPAERRQILSEFFDLFVGQGGRPERRHFCRVAAEPRRCLDEAVQPRRGVVQTDVAEVGAVAAAFPGNFVTAAALLRPEQRASGALHRSQRSPHLGRNARTSAAYRRPNQQAGATQ